MYLSRCFEKSKGPNKLGCISCHDPHRRPQPQQRISYFRKRCLACHQEHGCALAEPERRRRSPEDSCIACHMHRYDASDIPHVANTDHRILRLPEPLATEDAGAAHRKPTRKRSVIRPWPWSSTPNTTPAMPVMRRVLSNGWKRRCGAAQRIWTPLRGRPTP
jgi:hypothetical protein